VSQPRDDPPKRLFARERGVGEGGLTVLHGEDVVGAGNVDLQSLLVLEQRSDGPQPDQLAKGVACQELQVGPFRGLALLTHRLGLLSHRAVDLLR
jgi:hypothetical protein